MENRFYRLSVNAVGILLICAAILKLHALSLSGLETWLYPSALLVLVTIEFSIGAMLCIGRHGPRLYKASSLLFGAFLAYSVTTMVLGNPNCQCFGVVPHESWHSMLIDLGCLLVVLLGWVGPSLYCECSA